MCTCSYNLPLKATHCPIQPTTHGKEGSSEELRRELLVSPWPASYHEDEIDCVDTSLNTITVYFRSQPDESYVHPHLYLPIRSLSPASCLPFHMTPFPRAPPLSYRSIPLRCRYPSGISPLCSSTRPCSLVTFLLTAIMYHLFT